MAALNLAIAPYLPSIISAIKAHDISLIPAATGSGKSLGIPPELSGGTDRIFVTAPTTTAVTMLYARQSDVLASDKRFEKSGENAVGFCHRESKKYTKDTRIVYWTTGSMLNTFLGHVKKALSTPSDASLKSRSLCKYLMVDEIHNGSIENYLLLRLWLFMEENGFKVPKLVLTSATPAVQRLRDLFGDRLFIYPEIPVSTKPIKVVYETEPLKGPKALQTKMVQQTIQYDRELTLGGNFIVFLPGQREIESYVYELTKALGNTKLEIIPIYSSKAKEATMAIRAPLQAGARRKVVVATNIAESAITIGNTVLVLDSGLAKQNRYSKLDSEILEIVKISKASAEQRKGRTGRDVEGICHRFMTLREFEQLEATIREEIDYAPFHGFWLRVVSSLIDESKMFPNDPVRLKRTKDLCEMLGLIRDGKVTEKGNMISFLNMSIRTSSIVYDWFMWENSGKSASDQTEKFPDYPVVLLAAIIDRFDNSFVTDSEKSPNFDAWNLDCDLTIWFKMFAELIWPEYKARIDSSSSGLNFKPTVKAISSWCDKNGGNFNLINDTFKLAREVFEALVSVMKTKVKQVDGSVKSVERQAIYPTTIRVEDTLLVATPFIERAFSDMIVTYAGGIKFAHMGGKQTFIKDRYNSLCVVPREGKLIALSLKDRNTSMGTMTTIGMLFRPRGGNVSIVENAASESSIESTPESTTKYLEVPRLLSILVAYEMSMENKSYYGLPESEEGYQGWIAVS